MIQHHQKPQLTFEAFLVQITFSHGLFLFSPVGVSEHACLDVTKVKLGCLLKPKCHDHGFNDIIHGVPINGCHNTSNHRRRRGRSRLSHVSDDQANFDSLRSNCGLHHAPTSYTVRAGAGAGYLRTNRYLRRSC